MKSVFVVLNFYNELIDIYEKFEDAQKCVMSQVATNIDEDDFQEIGVETLHDYCEYFDWDFDILGCGIVEYAIK